MGGGGEELHSTEVAFLHLTPQPGVPKKISEEKNVHVAEVNQRRWLEESGQMLENVVPTQLVLASGKLVLQK